MLANNTNDAAATALRCRQIAETDIDAVATLLARGFPGHGRDFWYDALTQLRRHEPPPGLPKYGYLLESRGTPVGAILLICSAVESGSEIVTRCNLSSWYVEPSFRAYAPMLVAHAMRHKNVTYTNVSSAPHTRPIIEAQGFLRYSDGVFVAVPALQGLLGGPAVKICGAEQPPTASFEPYDQQVLREHAAHGCVSLWCVTPERAYPFVFRPRLLRGLLPCAQLIYCHDVADFVRFAGPLGRRLLRQGQPIILVDANGPVPGLVGWFARGRMPRYFKGPTQPRLGDLAYTEYAVLGV